MPAKAYDAIPKNVMGIYTLTKEELLTVYGSRKLCPDNDEVVAKELAKMLHPVRKDSMYPNATKSGISRLRGNLGLCKRYPSKRKHWDSAPVLPPPPKIVIPPPFLPLQEDGPAPAKELPKVSAATSNPLLSSIRELIEIERENQAILIEMIDQYAKLIKAWA
jgi:hypothetical protein